MVIWWFSVTVPVRVAGIMEHPVEESYECENDIEDDDSEEVSISPAECLLTIKACK